MKSIFDASFRYTPSYETNLRKTFERLRRERQAIARRHMSGPSLRVELRSVPDDAAASRTPATSS